jgi:hypothetical protein
LFDFRNHPFDLRYQYLAALPEICRSKHLQPQAMRSFFAQPIPLNTYLLFVLLLLVRLASAQSDDSKKRTLNLRGSISATNNGFSLIPTFSLGKPALVTIFSMSGSRRISFEPEFRYGLDFKPWSFVFIWRYKLIRREKFQFILGTHLPALNFVTTSVLKNGVQTNVIQTRRFFPVVEAMPRYIVSKNVSLSLFYLYGGGYEKGLVKHSNFFNFGATFQRIPLHKKWFLRFNPQLYYLQMDANDGFYTAAGLTLVRQNFPISIGTLMNKKLKTSIVSKDFDWNVSLIYAFDKKYVRQ